MKIQISEITSIGIKAQAEKDGITEITLLAESGTGDSKISIYQFGPVRVADTNGDPVWEESDPSAFEEMLKDADINL